MKKALLPVVVLSMVLLACNSAPEADETKTAPPAPVAPAHVPDHTSLFPLPGQSGTSIVPDHILDMKSMPGGSLAEYDVKGKKYRMFIIDAETAQKAAFLMLDMKTELKKDPEYIAYMGGYFGMYGDKPLYCFAKLHYLAGLVGLTKDKADPMMRSLAAQLH